MNRNAIRGFIAALVVGTAANASATPIQFTFDTSSLTGTQMFAFALTDGDPASSNTATISAFDFGGGAAVSGTEDCTLLGATSGAGCLGSMATAVTLTDSGLAPEILTGFLQQFDPGIALSFTLDTTNAFDPASGAPDQIAFYLFPVDPAAACPSTDFACTLATLDLVGRRISPDSFTISSTLPTQIATSDPVPEPATLLLVGGGLAATLRRRHRSR